MTSPVAWMGLRTCLVFSFWASVKEGDVGGPGLAGPDRTGPGAGGGGMNVTLLGFGFPMTSPVSWMRFTDSFGFLFGPA